MTLKVLVEILVHLDTFRNIDLFFQGVYFLKLKMHHAKPLQPYWNFTTTRQDERDKYMPKGTDPHNVFRPLAEQDEDCYITKGFMIRYCEEEAEINEVVMFRTELELEPGF